MNNPLQNLFYNVGEKIIGYLPNLVAALLLIGLGWFFGWLTKRIIVQICRILRLERLIQRLRWAAILSKGDVRHGLYNFIGSIAGFIVFLIFLSNALNILNLMILSNLLEKGIIFLPKFIIATLIIGIGGLIAKWVSEAIRKALTAEEFPRAGLIARLSKAVIILFFSAMALTEIDIASEIVIIGFSTIIITVSILVIVITAQGGKKLTGKILETFVGGKED